MKRLIYLLLFLILLLCGMTGCALDESVSSITPKVGDAVYAKNEQSGQTEYKPVTPRTITTTTRKPLPYPAIKATTHRQRKQSAAQTYKQPYQRAKKHKLSKYSNLFSR